MKIKNQATQQSLRNRQNKRTIVANKENMPTTEHKPDQKPYLRSRSAFGDDITKRINEPVNNKYNYTLTSQEISIELPKFLKKPTAFTSQITLYEQQIIDYLIESYDKNVFSESQISKMNKKHSKRKYVIQKLYKVYKLYKLRRKTLYLTVYYYDKYMRNSNEKDLAKLTLIGEACMLIAMKYEEIYPPLLGQWAFGRQGAIIMLQSKILAYLNFKLAQTTTQHYLQIYQGKNVSDSKQEKKLHEIVLDLYLFTGTVYTSHPLKVVQGVLQSFRSTSFMEKNTKYEESDKFVKQLIHNNQKIWEFLLQMEIYDKKK